MVPGTTYILCSAIWYKDLKTQAHLPRNCDKGIVLCGWRHGNIIGQMSATMNLRSVENGDRSVGKYTQGFLTNKGMFVDRIEAAKIAYDSGQTKEQLNQLYSEDVW